MTWSGGTTGRTLRTGCTPFCLFESLNEVASQKIKIPSLFEEVQYQPIPQPDPAPYKLSELAKLYTAKSGASAGPAGKFSVSPHRFAAKELHAVMAGSFNQEAVTAKINELAGLGIDWQAVLSQLGETDANVSYEQIECLGLDNNLGRVAATFRIKQSTGYSGNLCHAGSEEFVAFCADRKSTRLNSS